MILSATKGLKSPEELPLNYEAGSSTSTAEVGKIEDEPNNFHELPFYNALDTIIDF
ncbi:MAG: hypothetical protein MTP17_03905 [Candidatus Midichloria sp.]|nr:MAG: hypothetical protein MTP17_03905 [Candidatus Midichloria sp.]